MADQTNDAVSDERLRELLPCPFCGGEPKMHHINFGYSSLNAGRDGYRVECTECSAMQPAYDLVEAEAIAAWNRRSVTSQASEGEVVAYRVRHKGDERWALTFTDPRVTPSGAINDEIEAEPLGLITEGLVTPPYSRGVEAALVKGDEASASSPVASPSKRVERLETALNKIVAWEFPETGKFWENTDGTMSDRPMSYGAAFGSNGERDYMREIARQALGGRS